MDYTKEAEKLIENMPKMRPHIDADNVNKLSKGEMHLLITLMDLGGDTSVGDLTKNLPVSSARVAAILNLSEEKGYVRRENVPGDRRKTRVVLTDVGRDMLLKERTKAIRQMAEYLEFLGEEDANSLLRILDKTHQFMKERKCEQ